MNKKLLIGIIAGVVALGVLVAVIIAASTGLFSGDKTGGGKDPGIAGGSQNELDASSTIEIEEGEVKIGSAEGKAEDEDVVAVTVKVKENPGMAAAQLFIEFDKDAFYYDSYAEGEVFDEYTVEDLGGKVGCILSVSDITKNATEDGALVTLKFAIKKDAKKGDYELKIGESTLFADKDENTVDPKISTGIIRVR